MQNFTYLLAEKLQPLSAFNELHIEANHKLFKLQKGKVAQFIQEIQQTGEVLNAQTNSYYADFYAQRLIQQFNLLKKLITQHSQTTNKPPVFQSNYRFPKNIHNLSPEKRLLEYQKALRLLNEKLTWLMSQAQISDDEQRQYYITQITETEYRKQKCLRAIDKLK